jgi:hypothetical protein
LVSLEEEPQATLLPMAPEANPAEPELQLDMPLVTPDTDTNPPMDGNLI